MLVGQHFKSWSLLSQKMPGRSSKQCRERWTHHLDPSIFRGEYTAEEDAKIINLQREHGNKWSEIAKMLPGRTENAVKIRYKQLRRPPKDKDKSIKNTAKWTGEEDAALKNAVAIHGEKNWKAIAEQVANRDHVQCLQRFKKVLKEGLAKGHWSPEEDCRLVRILDASLACFTSGQ